MVKGVDKAAILCHNTRVDKGDPPT